MIIERWVPLIGWLRTYHRGLLTRDVLAAVIVTLMLVPQALAYAMLAGLPPEMGSMPACCRWCCTPSLAPARVWQ